MHNKNPTPTATKDCPLRRYGRISEHFCEHDLRSAQLVVIMNDICSIKSVWGRGRFEAEEEEEDRSIFAWAESTRR